MILSLVRHAETVVDPALDPADWPLSPGLRGGKEGLPMADRGEWLICA